jgi:hypothetical protein
MTRYAVAYISFHDNDMKMQIIDANSERNALIFTLKLQGWETSDLDLLKATPEELKQYAFDCDSMIGAIALEEPNQ